MRRHKYVCLPMLCAALVAALVLTAGLLPTPALAAMVSGGTDTTYTTILGDAVNYGIVAGTFTLRSGDAQTNVAAQHATSRTQTGNDLTNPVEQPFILARIADEFRIKGNDALVQTNADDARKVVGTGGTNVTLFTSRSANELHDEVGGMLAHGAEQSELLASHASTAEVTYDEQAQKFVIDIRDHGTGTHIVEIGQDAYERISNEASKLRIFKHDDQTLVLNVAGPATRMQKFDINGRGADSFLEKDAGKVPQTLIWNFPDATDLTIAGSVTGVVLAPHAAVTVHATSSGWLVARDVTIGNGEWHNVYQQVEPVRPSEPSQPEEPERPSGPEQPEQPDSPVVPDGAEPGIPQPRLMVRATKTAMHDRTATLENATYGLWQVGTNGADDRHIASKTSSANGELLFELPNADAATYFLLEEDAPFGYLISPHPTDRFAIGWDEQGPYLQHENSSELVRGVSEPTNDVLVFDYEPRANPVADHGVHVVVNKLDRATEKPLSGAELQVLDKQTGEVMASWTSGEKPFELVRTLDTERTYVLREVRAPNGYAGIADVEFVLHEKGDHTTGLILVGAETARLVPDEETGVLRIDLLNARSPLGTGSSASAQTSWNGLKSLALPATGDTTALLATVVLASIGASALIASQRMR